MLSCFFNSGPSKRWTLPKVPQENGTQNINGHYVKLTQDTITILHTTTNDSNSVSYQNGTSELQAAVETEEKASDVQERRSGVRAQTINTDDQNFTFEEIPKHKKSNEDEDLIRTAIASNGFLPNLLDGEKLQMIVDAMYPKEVKSKEIIIREGTEGHHMYVSASGVYEISIKGKNINNFNDNRVFGELAILYNAKRQATIRALKDGKLWVLDSEIYQKIMVQSAIQKRNELVQFLRNVPKLNKKSDEVLGLVSDLLRNEFFFTGMEIVREGDKGDKFYIITAGSVSVTKRNEGKVATLTRGQYFGERALLKEDCRQATVTADAPGVECLTLTRSHFVDYFGDIDPDFIPTTEEKQVVRTKLKREFEDIRLKDLIPIETLGVGGFGRVELVQHKTKKQLTFALKYLKKYEMVKQQQQQHTLNERNIQMSCESPFIVRLYNTFKDDKYLYFLMESCLGGDLWTLLQKQKTRRFEESVARFYTGCVLEAFAYLHERGIIYRDLKPENLLLDNRGYLKLTDFGFAKTLPLRGKTYTFAGTPEYVAPEIVLARGHDKATDYWAFGIFIYELLVGKTPFRSNDSSHMTTYNLILRGIDSMRFPEVISRPAQNLIKKLCKSMASERLGCQKDGAEDIRRHKWYLGFDWKKLRNRAIKAPIGINLRSNIDTQYFDKYQKDSDIPPDDHSPDFADF
ncbi:cGMP-dependent protein kinase, isozyme 1-like [Agrilus planipennis]|uniref:cGMP-dependent protein kinase n=1 Tax=Agrilus planipennis TaxID=224129 RepID=A0A1W4WZR8_AGRPL|nr:cGMP-dependent protein kinase, isozyme 1-like [Agrilus planipennis]